MPEKVESGRADERRAPFRRLTWNDVIALHDQAVDRYANLAARVVEVPGLWDAPRAPGKWSPAEITLHLVMVFDAVAREIETGRGMASRTRWYHRVVIRATFYRRMLAGGRFPTGARAPRETRPPRPAEDATSLISRFRTSAQRLIELVRIAHDERASLRLSHPYFGRIPLAEAVYMSASHIDHHRAQLPAPPVSAAER